jgi:hypothetical protein
VEEEAGEVVEEGGAVHGFGPGFDGAQFQSCLGGCCGER